MVIQSQSVNGSRGHLDTVSIFRRGVRNRADADDMIARVNNHHGAGRTILPPIDMAFAIFVAPEIRVLNYIARPHRNGVGQSIHLVIELDGLGRRLGRLEQADRLFVKISRQNDPTIPGFQPGILVRGDQYRRRLPVAENLHRFTLGITKNLAKLALRIGCLDLRHQRSLMCGIFVFYTKCADSAIIAYISGILLTDEPRMTPSLRTATAY